MAPKVHQSNEPLIELSQRSEPRTYRREGTLTTQQEKAREDDFRGDKD